MADQKAVIALQPFILLTKNAGPAACKDIILRAIEAPGCFVFGELLEVPSVRKLEGTEHEPYVTLLRIFAYGSYTDYKSTPNLPSLNSTQLHKLKQLSLISLASASQSQPLRYSYLLEVLDLPDIRALEDLVISAIYAGLLEAKLDTARQTVEVSSAAGRDIAPGDVEHMISILSAWSSQADAVLSDLDAEISRIYTLAAERKEENETYLVAVEAKKKKLLEGKGKRGVGEGGGDEMEVDEDEGPGRRRKRFGLGGMGGKKR